MLLIAAIIVVKLWCLCTKGDALTKKYKHTHLKQTNKQANKQTLYVQLLLDSRPLALNPLQSTRKIQDYLWCFLKLNARDTFVAFPAPSHFRTSRLLTPAHQKYCMVSLCTLHPRQNMADLVNKMHHHTTRPITTAGNRRIQYSFLIMRHSHGWPARWQTHKKTKKKREPDYEYIWCKVARGQGFLKKDKFRPQCHSCMLRGGLNRGGDRNACVS